ncbi:hypothetical protein ABFX02_02G161600 [Erythranthe guttata]
MSKNENTEEDGIRARSFRYEDYNTRRVFLRSYPLRWGAEAESEAEEEISRVPVETTKRTNGKKPIKKVILAIVRWGEERVLVFRRIKHKITVFIVNCVPVSFKVSTALISVK